MDLVGVHGEEGLRGHNAMHIQCLDKEGALVMQIGTAASDARTMRIFGGKFVFPEMNLFRNPDIRNSF